MIMRSEEEIKAVYEKVKLMAAYGRRYFPDHQGAFAMMCEEVVLAFTLGIQLKDQPYESHISEKFAELSEIPRFKAFLKLRNAANN
jgi:hypothetical protein